MLMCVCVFVCVCVCVAVAVAAVVVVAAVVNGGGRNGGGVFVAVPLGPVVFTRLVQHRDAHVRASSAWRLVRIHETWRPPSGRTKA